MSPSEVLAAVDVGFCLPLVLLLNFSLFQYLLTTFWNRRRERRVRLLLGLAFVGFAGLMPFALSDLARNLNQISEVCTLLTFLVQITILTRDVGKRIKIRSIWRLMWIGEILTIVCIGVLGCNVIDIFAPAIRVDLVDLLDMIARNAALVFIVGFRFYFLAMIKGFHIVIASQKVEIFCYLLFLTHSWPFMLLEHITESSWHHVSGAWMRITVAACLSMTIKSRLNSKNSKGIASAAGPMASCCDNGVAVIKPTHVSSGTTFMGSRAMKVIAPYQTATTSSTVLSSKITSTRS